MPTSTDRRYFKRYADGKFVVSWEADEQWTEKVRAAARLGFELRVVFNEAVFREQLEAQGVPADVVARIVESIGMIHDAFARDDVA